jgi:hypothetical protein
MTPIDLNLLETLELVDFLKGRIGVTGNIVAVSIHYSNDTPVIIYCDNYSGLDNQAKLDYGY